MGHFVANDSLNLFAGHVLQQTGGHGHQGSVFVGTCGECVGVTGVDGHFGHAHASLVGKAADGIHDPLFVGVAGLVDDFNARCGPFGHLLAHEQGNDGSAKTHDERKTGERSQVQPVGGEEPVHTQQARGDEQHGHHGQVGQDEKSDAFHGNS